MVFKNKDVFQYSLKYLLKRKTAFIWLFLFTFLSIIIPLLTIYYPKFIIEFIELREWQSALMSVIYFITLETVLYILNTVVQTKIQGIQRDVDSQIYAEIADINISIPYQVSESNDFVDNKNKALAGINVRSGTVGIYLTICSVASATVRIILSGITLSMLNICFFPIMLITILINVFVYSYINKLEEKFWNSLIRFNRMFSYVFMKLSCSFQFAKDIRLYSMSDIIDEKNRNFIQYTRDVFQKKDRESLPYKMIHEAIGQIQMLLIYGFLLYSAFKQGIGVADFTVLLSTALALKGWLNTIIYGCVDINISCNYLRYFYNLYTYKKTNSPLYRNMLWILIYGM